MINLGRFGTLYKLDIFNIVMTAFNIGLVVRNSSTYESPNKVET